MTERRLLNEMPMELRTLVRYVTVLFYSTECQIVMEMMSYYRRITEKRILELLKFDKKMFRSTINSLKHDKFIYTGEALEMGPDNKTTKQTYYYVNYGVLVNVIKYKLHHLRTEIQTAEKTPSPSYSCPNCCMQFTDLDVGLLIDFNTQSLQCHFCKIELVTNSGDAKSEMTVAKFNERIEPIFSLLGALDKIQFPDTLLKPSPIADLNAPKGNGTVAFSGEATRRNTSSKREIGSVTNAAKQKKEIPAWVSQNAIGIPELYAKTDPIESVKSPKQSSDAIKKYEVATITKYLSSEEPPKKVFALDQAGKPSRAPLVEEDEEEFTVTIRGKKVEYNDITNEMVNRMSELEKQEYIRVGMDMHAFYE